MVIQSNGYSLVTHISAVCIWTWTVIWLMRWLTFCSNTSFVHESPHWYFCNVLWKNVAVSDTDFSVYSELIPCEEETAQMQWLLCVCIGATSVRRWMTWNRDEHSRHIWTCHNMMHVANTVTYIMANDNEIFNQEMKWQHGATWHDVSKKEGRSCIFGQQRTGSLWIGRWLIFGLKWES